MLVVPVAIWSIHTAFEIVDRLAAAARFSFNDGRLVGTYWYRYSVPAVLAATDFINAANAEIKWRAGKTSERQSSKGGPPETRTQRQQNYMKARNKSF